MEKLYSFFCIVVMIVNFVLMTYQERRSWEKVFLINLVSIGIYSLAFLDLQKISNGFFILITSIILIIPFFLSLRFCPSMRFFYLGVSLVCFARIFGFPHHTDLREKELGLALALASGVYYMLLLWTYFLFFHSKKYQKILFYILSVWAIFLSVTSVSSFFQLENTLIYPIIEYFNIAYGLAILLGFGLSFILFAPFFNMGELILFSYLCFRYFEKGNTDT